MKSIKFAVILFLLLLLASPVIANEDIFLMVRKGDIDSVRKVIAEIKDINIKNEYGATPLHSAVIYGFSDIVKLLVNASADVNTKDKKGITPLHSALFPPHEDDEVFHDDLYKNKTQIIEILLTVNADVNAQDNAGLTPLMHLSMLYGRYKSITGTQFISQILELFSKTNIYLNLQDVGGMTALSWAASESNENVVAWLIQNKADVHLKDNNGMTALLWAAMEGNADIVRMLINTDVDVNTKNTAGANALWYASLRGNMDMVLALLEHGAEVNLYAEGITPLHLATGLGVIVFSEKREGESFQEVIKRLGFSEDNFLQMTKALVEGGADVYAQSYAADHKWYEKLQNRTPFEYAQAIGSKEVANYLKSVMERGRKKRWYWPF